MQLRKMMLVLTALGAMSGLMAGCGDEETGSTTCTSNDQCSGTEICHPTAGVCVTTCESGSDCPDTAKTCAPLGGTSSEANTKICQCSTDVLCNGGTGSDSTNLVCSDLDNVCVTKCTADSDCTGTRTCNTGTGQCEEGETGPTTCSGEGQTTCSYGQFCSSSTCTAVPAPTCVNFDPAQGGKQPVWTTSSTGPIIFDITKLSWAPDTISPAFCASGDVLKVRVKAYQPASSSATFPTQKSALGGLFYVTVNGNQQDGASLIRPSEYAVSQNGKVATFTMNFCPGAISTISLGLYFSNGNEICSQVSK